MSEVNSKKWINLLKRLTQVANTEYVNHCKIIKITIVTDNLGNPVAWSEPQCSKVEPMNGGAAWVNLL